MPPIASGVVVVSTKDDDDNAAQVTHMTDSAKASGRTNLSVPVDPI